METMTTIKLIALSALIVLVTACAPAVSEPVGDNGVERYIERYVDTEAGVTCWIYSNGYQGGISCLPIEQTKLDK